MIRRFSFAHRIGAWAITVGETFWRITSMGTVERSGLGWSGHTATTESSSLSPAFPSLAPPSPAFVIYRRGERAGFVALLELATWPWGRAVVLALNEGRIICLHELVVQAGQSLMFSASTRKVIRSYGKHNDTGGQSILSRNCNCVSSTTGNAAH